MKRYTGAYLHPQYAAAVRALSARTHVPAAEYYRDAIHVYLDTQSVDDPPRPKHPKTTGRLELVGLYLEDEQIRALRNFAKAARLSQAEVIRDALALYLAEEKRCSTSKSSKPVATAAMPKPQDSNSSSRSSPGSATTRTATRRTSRASMPSPRAGRSTT